MVTRPSTRLGELWRKPKVRFAIELAALMLFVTLIGMYQTRGHVTGPAPAFALQTLSGQTVSLDSLKGKPALVVFWAPWCGVCKAEAGNFSWAQKVLGDSAHVVSIASQWNQVSEVERYAAEQKVDYPVLLDPDGLSQKFKVEAFPTVYFLDAEGKVKRSVVGYTTTVGLVLRVLLP